MKSSGQDARKSRPGKNESALGIAPALGHCPGVSEDLLLAGIQKLILRPVQKHDVSEGHKSCGGFILALRLWIGHRLSCRRGSSSPADSALRCSVLCGRVFPKCPVSPPQKELQDLHMKGKITLR